MFLHVHRRRNRRRGRVSASTGDANNENCDSSWSRGSPGREHTRSSSTGLDRIGVPPNSSTSNGWSESISNRRGSSAVGL